MMDLMGSIPVKFLSISVMNEVEQEMKDFDTKPYWISAVIVAATVFFMTEILAHPVNLEIEDSAIWAGLALLVVPSIFFVAIVAHLKVGPMASVWRMPKHTFLFSRTLLRLIGSCLIGNLFATTLLSFSMGGFFIPILLFVLPVSTVFVYSTSKRFQRHPKTEFTMRYSQKKSKIHWV